MKNVKLIVELDLGVVDDGFDLQVDTVETLIGIQEQVTVPYKTLELVATDIDTQLITNHIIIGAEKE